MVLDQVAYFANDVTQATEIKRMFGLLHADWVTDDVEGEVLFPGIGDVFWSKAFLQFNYDLGIELEILTYLEGPHWHMNKPEFKENRPFLSHIGFHMDGSVPYYPHIMDDYPTELVQVMDTRSHTNPYLVEKGRRYHYEIYQMPVGPDHKLIWRREP